MSDLWMCGMTPPPAIVALMRVSSSSSPRMASCKWRGVIRFTLRSLQALPANSRTSAVRYSKIAEVYTAAVAPTRWLCWTDPFKKRCTRPTGNYLLKRISDEKRVSQRRFICDVYMNINLNSEIMCSPAIQPWMNEIGEPSCWLGPFRPFLPCRLCLLFRTMIRSKIKC